MSYNNPSFKTQRTHNSHVSSPSSKSDLDYIKSQSQILEKQNQKNLDKIPSHINPIPNDEIIKQAGYHINTRNPINNTLKSLRNTSQNILPQQISQSSSQSSSQSQLINENEQYDPYIDFQKKKGLFNDNNKNRIKTTIHNIDSRARKTIPTLTKINETLLRENPLYFSSSTSLLNTTNNILTVTIPNHEFKVADKITLTNITTKPVSIYSTYEYKNDSIPQISRTGYSVILEQNKKSLIIKCDYTESIFYGSNNTYILESSFGLPPNFSFDPNFSVGDGILFNTLKSFDTSKLYVSISGFDGITIGNIPTNFLNSTHRIYFINPDSSGNTLINVPDGNGIVKKITGFYISLSTDYIGPPITNMKINITYAYIGGIPINSLNADIPITNNNINGYFEIESTTKNTINIKLPQSTYYINPTPKNNPQIGETPIIFGGNSIYISLVDQIESAYNDPNNYVIELLSSVHNAFMVRLVNTIFFNTLNAFKNNSNKIYWQNIDDGNYEYSITIANGNYTPNELGIELQKLMYSVPRVNTAETPIDPYGGYTNKTLFEISISASTNITSFTSYKEAILRQPILSILDKNDQPPPVSPLSGSPPYTVKIRQPKHGLTTGDTILLEGFIDTLGVPAHVLNAKHTLNNVIDIDTYEFIIDNFNLNYVRVDEKGGFSCKIYVNNVFRLLFNKSDTMGVQLGFRNVGNETSITKYSTSITNKDAYQNEIVTIDPSTGINYVSDGSGSLIVLKNNSLQLIPNDYVLMVIREFSGCYNIGSDKQLIEYFAKINFSEIIGRRLVDTFVAEPVIFYDMIDIDRLTISFYGSDGKLFDFNGVDHSFVIEIQSIDLLPEQTGINTTNNIL